LTRLDDLLTYDVHPKRSRPRRSGAWRLITPIVVAVVVSVVAQVVLKGMRVGVPFALVFASVAALVALRYTLRALDIQPLPATLRASAPVRRMPRVNSDGMSNAARTWSGRLEFAQDDPGRLNRIVRPALVDIIDERIRLRHGITRASDPERFGQIVGPELWKFMTEPLPQRFTPHMMATLVAQMEAL
jgi:hypothetical protein